MRKSTHLLVIDGQNDFCDLPEDWLPRDALSERADARIHPQLAVPGAHLDMLRLAAAIDAARGGLDELTLTLDSHHAVGIERTTFWRDSAGAPVDPFTPISAAQVRAGEFVTADPANIVRAIAYLDALEATGRGLMVWTVHCVQGTWGQALHASLARSAARWEELVQRPSSKLYKGHNPWTEHYSPFLAEVPLASDPSTQYRVDAVDRILQSDQVYIAGEASSHCVMAGVQDLVRSIERERCQRVALVQDAMSPVQGFERSAADFFEEMADRGVRLVTCAEMQQELEDNAASR